MPYPSIHHVGVPSAAVVHLIAVLRRRHCRCPSFCSDAIRYEGAIKLAEILTRLRCSCDFFGGGGGGVVIGSNGGCRWVVGGGNGWWWWATTLYYIYTFIAMDFGESWADSCLVEDSEISYSNWDSMKDALRRILTSQPDSLEHSAAKRNGLIELRRTVGDAVPCNEEIEQNCDDDCISDKDKYNSRTKLGNPFLPNYSEYMKDIESPVPGLDSDFPAFVMDPSPSGNDIFRVWNLDIPVEEDELITQLNWAFAESSLLPVPSSSDDSGLKEESLVHLIAGISDSLSIKILDDFFFFTLESWSLYKLFQLFI
ncbi:Sarcoplasmic reticulum histidine-rich calcium-binding protein [Actinidia chinensis var. chinensis]|uniref:Sarcoplasmic reticulum histidine-rich calcium-binding protein n=1 Tax=Actinidia chinensis var. chinensis TaxID=1590841 RepID=A0A2R6RHI8_ACTCC|nr:Sarcoplasmic reticulum histidine-rich calcium-binding protein [Actinidia chinensis var. chinensis]